MLGGQDPCFNGMNILLPYLYPDRETDIMIKAEALTNFTKQALLDRTKAIQALNEEQIQMRKMVIHNRMALHILRATQGGSCALIKVECCAYIPDLLAMYRLL